MRKGDKEGNAHRSTYVTSMEIVKAITLAHDVSYWKKLAVPCSAAKGWSWSSVAASTPQITPQQILLMTTSYCKEYLFGTCCSKAESSIPIVTRLKVLQLIILGFAVSPCMQCCQSSYSSQLMTQQIPLMTTSYCEECLFGTCCSIAKSSAPVVIGLKVLQFNIHGFPVSPDQCCQGS